MLELLIEHFNRICHMPQELTDDLWKCAEVKEYKKDEFISRAGMVANHVSFILKGLVRSYYLRDGDEITTKLLQKGSILASIYSFYSRKPANEYTVALEDTILASFHYDTMQELYKKHPCFNIITRVIAEHYLYSLEIELYNLRKIKAEDRYKYFVKHFPEILQKVPLKYIATYLGMNLETLSRIRARRK